MNNCTKEKETQFRGLKLGTGLSDRCTNLCATTGDVLVPQRIQYIHTFRTYYPCNVLIKLIYPSMYVCTDRLLVYNGHVNVGEH